ncbi:MAG: hypothetical protein JWQ35_2388 [Bacteriovoracaceae bacterium]|nr:hypothetical protein [Bacteriovoracaceae bacterium]
MEDFAKLPDDEKKIYFEKAHSITGLGSLVIEKDFWVCWALKRLFSISEIKSYVTFKGGTSLSKAYGLIQRFSEDIDISIDRSLMGFTGSRDPANKSREKREKLLAELKVASKKFVQNNLLNQIKVEFQKNLNPSQKWKIETDSLDPDGQTLLFEYPSLDLALGSSYLKQIVKLEFGTRGEQWPSERRPMSAYVSKVEPSPIKQASFEVQVLAFELL